MDLFKSDHMYKYYAQCAHLPCMLPHRMIFIFTKWPRKVHIITHPSQTMHITGTCEWCVRLPVNAEKLIFKLTY
jgi:hypothetical protein